MTVFDARTSDDPLILTLDTAGPACQVALARGAHLVTAQSQTMMRGHGEALVPMVEAVLQEAGVTYEHLDRIGVTIGPGSFTGMRVALAAARGFSATLNVPIVGIGTLEALARTDLLETGIQAVRCASMDARNGLVYGQRFDVDSTALEAPDVMADLVFAASLPDNARLVGPATPIIAALALSSRKPVTLGNTDAVPSAAALAQLAHTGAITEQPKPLYLKAPDAIAAKPAGLRTY